MLALGFVFYPMLDTNIIRLQLDVYVLFFLAVSLLFLEKNKLFYSSFFVAIAFCLKLYPIVLLIVLLARDWKISLLGFLSGCFLCLLFSVCVLGFCENWFFWRHIFPILLHELPAGGGDSNISFPTALVGYLLPFWTMLKTGTFSFDDLVARYTSGEFSQIFVEQMVSDVRYLAKGLTFFWLLAMVALLIRCQKRGSLNFKRHWSLFYAAFVVFVVVFTQNSWLNYQVVLVLPMMVAFEYLFFGSKQGVFVRCFFSIGLFAWWGAASLDAAQERVNHFPPASVPVFLVRLTHLLDGVALSEWTRQVRCWSGVILLVVLLFFACERHVAKTEKR